MITVSYDDTALKDLEKLPKGGRHVVVQKISLLSDPDFRHYQLKGVTHDGQRSFRARAGYYRILYIKPHQHTVIIYGIRHRKNAYK